MDTTKKKPTTTIFNDYAHIRTLLKWLGYKIDLNFKSIYYERMIINCAKDSIFIPIQDGRCVRVGINLKNSFAISRKSTQLLNQIGAKKVIENTCKNFLVVNNSEKRIREIQC